jgi:hypothetical protein
MKTNLMEPQMHTTPSPGIPEIPEPTQPQREVDPGHQPEPEFPESPNDPTIIPDPQLPEITPGTPFIEVPPLM